MVLKESFILNIIGGDQGFFFSMAFKKLRNFDIYNVCFFYIKSLVLVNKVLLMQKLKKKMILNKI